MFSEGKLSNCAAQSRADHARTALCWGVFSGLLLCTLGRFGVESSFSSIFCNSMCLFSCLQKKAKKNFQLSCRPLASLGNDVSPQWALSRILTRLSFMRRWRLCVKWQLLPTNISAPLSPLLSFGALNGCNQPKACHLKGLHFLRVLLESAWMEGTFY